MESKSIKSIIDSSKTRSFRPIGAESAFVSKAGLSSSMSRHTPQSQMSQHFSRPGFGFSTKDILTTTPAARQEFARKMVDYQKEMARQRQLAESISQLDKSYADLKLVEQQKIRSVEDLNRAIRETKKHNQKLETQYTAIEKELEKQRQAEIKTQQMAMSSASTSRKTSSSGGRVIKPTETINLATGQIVDRSTGRVIASPAYPTQQQLKAMQFSPAPKPTSRLLRGVTFQFIKK
jgi:vacuolar-type H+-ATPase subunit I/STV1